MPVQRTPPAEVTLVYRTVGKTYVFTSEDLPGYHIGSATLERAFELAVQGLGYHVSKIYGCHAQYSTQPFAEFEAHLKGEGLFKSCVFATRKSAFAVQDG